MGILDIPGLTRAQLAGLTQQTTTGTQTITATTGYTYEITATGNTTLTLSGINGTQVALVVTTGGYNVTIEGAPLGGGTYVAHKITTGWKIYPVGDAIILTSVTATAPIFDDNAATYTIIAKTGVEYLVGGVVKAAGTYTSGPSTSVTITARATAGYVLTGTNTWTHAFPAATNITDNFSWATATNYGLNADATSSGNATWVSPWTPAGSVVGTSELTVTVASKDVTSSSGSAYVSTTTANQKVSLDYDVTGNTAKQVRVYARGSVTDLSKEITAIILGTGVVKYQLGGATWVDLGTAQPLTGRLSLEVIGTTGRVLVNGTQVGASFSTTNYGVGMLAGMGILSSAKVDNFEVVYL